MLVVLEIRDAVRDVGYWFRPVVHLRTGGVIAVEIHVAAPGDEAGHVRPRTANAERQICLDVAFAVEALRRARHHRVGLPLHLSLWADTVCARRDPLGPLLDALPDLRRDPQQVVVRLVVPASRNPPGNLAVGVSRLRAAAVGLAMDAGAYPVMTLIDVRPEVLLLAGGHTAGLPAAPRARAALASALTLAEQTGTTLIAGGCDTTEQAVALREHGVYQVQGNLLGRSRQYPDTQPIPPAVLDRRLSPATGATAATTAPGGTDAAASPAVVADLAHPAATMPLDTTGEAARELFAHQPGLTGVVLVDDRRHPVCTLNRDRFMLAITGPFGHSLHAKRPAAGLADPPRTLALQTSLSAAVDMVADTPTRHLYDDIVLVDEHGRCRGVLRVRDLVRDLAQPHRTRFAAAAR